MSYVQVSNVPTSASPGELQELFEQCGSVRQLVCQFERGCAEGSALVAFADAGGAQEAVDLLDSYPLGTSLLELVGADQFVGRLVSKLLAARDPWSGQEQQPPPGPSAVQQQQPVQQQHASGAEGGDSVAALEAEMRELQLALQQQADTLHETAAAAAAQRWQEAQQQRQGAAGGDEGWQDAAARPRKPLAGPAVLGSGQGQRGVGRNDDEPNTGLWIGWIGLKVSEEELGRAFSRWGPLAVERLVQADRLADDGKRYQWAIVRYKHLEHAIAAKQAADRKPMPGITVGPSLKVTYYKTGHQGSSRRG